MICHCERTKLFSKGFAHERSRQCDLYEWQTSLGHTDDSLREELFYAAKPKHRSMMSWESGVNEVGPI